MKLFKLLSQVIRLWYMNHKAKKALYKFSNRMDQLQRYNGGNMKKCKCGREIPEARLRAIPDTDVCVKCSVTKKKLGVIEDGEVINVIEQTPKVEEYVKSKTHKYE